VSSAAVTVGLSQAAASQALAELENLLERKLFDRIGKRLVLNAEGKRLFPATVEVLDRIAEMEGAEANSTELKLGASLTVGCYMLPRLIASFCRERADCRVQLHVRNTEQVVGGLLNFEFDVGWVEGFVQAPDLVAERWARDELVVIAPPAHRLAAKKEATLRELSGETWILREKGSGTREVFERAIHGRMQLERIIEISEIEAVKRMVAAGGGLGCVSRAAVVAELQAGELREVRVAKLNLERDIVLLIHKNKYVSRDLSEFLGHVRSGAAKP
jgi:DNA-binding transcriptional LysR family regulator